MQNNIKNLYYNNKPKAVITIKKRSNTSERTNSTNKTKKNKNNFKYNSKPINNVVTNSNLYNKIDNTPNTKLHKDFITKSVLKPRNIVLKNKRGQINLKANTSNKNNNAMPKQIKVKDMRRSKEQKGGNENKLKEKENFIAKNKKENYEIKSNKPETISKLSVNKNKIKGYNYELFRDKVVKTYVNLHSGKYRKIIESNDSLAALDDFKRYGKDLYITALELHHLFKETDAMCDYHGFDDLFLNIMKRYKNEIIKNGDFASAVDETNKDINNLRNRIGLIYYLYDNKINGNIEKDDVNKMSDLFNEILDIRKFLNIYYYFKNYLSFIMPLDEDEEGNTIPYRIPYKDLSEDFINDSKNLAQNLLRRYIYQKYFLNSFYLGNKQSEAKKEFIRKAFLNDYECYYIDLRKTIYNNIYDLYSILKKGNANINLIEENTKEIEESFRKHLYVKDNFVKYDNLTRIDDFYRDCRLLGADRALAKNYKKDFHVEENLKKEFTKKVLKHFDGKVKTEDLTISLFKENHLHLD